MRLWVIGLLFLASTSQAEVNLSVGTGKGVLGAPGTPFERVLAAGYQVKLSPDWFSRPEIGYFEDISGRGKSSVWVAPLVGVRALAVSGNELHIGMGPGYLQNPDSTLGGHFQFSLEGSFGIYDGMTYLGIAWKHLSSAGIEMPNNGRDFIVIQARF